jgi:tetratricopeptide (TPR) repeat protein
VLESFLLGKLAAAERKTVLAHLLQGCRRCRRVLAPLAEALFEPGLAEAPDDGGWRYEFVIRRTMRRVFSAAAATPTKPLAAAPLLKMPRPVWRRNEEQFRRCEAALAETRELGKRNPQEMLALAIGNATIAEHFDPMGFPPGAVYDLQARAFAELGNARRITDDFPSAEADFLRAVERARAGTGNLLLFAEIISMAASVYRATRRYDQTFFLLDRAYETYRELGEEHLTGRTLISKGIAKGSRGDLSEAIALLRQAVHLVDCDREPALLLAGIHNLIWFQVDSAQFAKGRTLIRTHDDLYRQHGGRFDLLRLHWLKGRIAAGLGELAEAEAAFLAARAGFAEHRLAYLEALISLDLAILWLRQGRKDEAGVLVEDMLSTFHALGIRREALAVLLVTRRPPRRLTPALLRSAAKLQRLEETGS